MHLRRKFNLLHMSGRFSPGSWSEMGKGPSPHQDGVEFARSNVLVCGATTGFDSPAQRPPCRDRGRFGLIVLSTESTASRVHRMYFLQDSARQHPVSTDPRNNTSRLAKRPGTQTDPVADLARNVDRRFLERRSIRPGEPGGVPSHSRITIENPG